MKLAWLLGLCFACGGRTGLGVVETLGEPDSGAPACPTTDSWLLFDVSSASGGVIYAARGDGGSMHALSLPGGRLQYPAMSPDGKTIAYDAIDANGSGSLRLYDVASGTSRLLVAHGGKPAWSLDGKTLAYGTGMDLRLVSADGSNDRLLLMGPSPQMTGYGNPSFVSASVLVFDRGGGVESMTTDGKRLSVLLVEPTNVIEFPNPSMSWDRRTMAVVAECGSGGVALRSYAFASLPVADCSSGTTIAKVDTGGVDYSASAWSPSGLIAFMQRQDLLVVATNDGAPLGAPSNVTESLHLVANNASANHPSWTPPCAKVP